MEHNEKLEQVLFFRCGYCENNLKVIFRGAKSRVIRFPANVFCIIHKDAGVLLFDTGYSRLIFEAGLVSKLYQRCNPASVLEEDEIVQKLAAYQIPRGAVRHLILSHAHPDHIGGLGFFPDAQVVLSPEVYATLKKGKVRELVFGNLKKQFTQNFRLLQERTHEPLLSGYFEEIYDVFGDCSIYAVKLDGHADGQIGLYLPSKRLFLAADSAWGADLIGQTERMRLLPRLIQFSYRDYLQTSCTLRRFKQAHPEIHLVFSHSDIQEGIYET